MSYKYNAIQIYLNTFCNYSHARGLCYIHNMWQNNVALLNNIFVNVFRQDKLNRIIKLTYLPTNSMEQSAS
jgi:hypothetical protein